MTVPADTLRRQMQFMEDTVASADVRASRALMAELLSDDFREFGASGRVFDKEMILATLSAEPDGDTYQVQDLEAQQLGPDTCLVTYRISPRMVAGTQKAGSNRSSIWRMEEGVWRILFHQGTRLPA